MDVRATDITVAGHICLDIIPTIRSFEGNFHKLLTPGNLVDVGSAIISTGGAVSNTGLALHRLGVAVRLMGKVGNDYLGKTILDVLDRNGKNLSDGMIVATAQQSSYSIVISLPDVDRIFLHCTGTNDTFALADLNLNEIGSTRLFHFGYPPLMRRMYETEGKELAQMLESVKTRGITVSLDLAKPDPNSASGKVNWESVLSKALPHVDFFLPSFEELLFMLDRIEYERMLAISADEDMINYASSELLANLSDKVIKMGVAAVMIKLGSHGIYVRTSSDKNRWLQVGECTPPELEQWIAREIVSSTFLVDVKGTTGAGDCTIAGFLTGVVKGKSIEEAITAAVAVGAFNVEQSDATSGIPDWDQVQERIGQGWQKRPMNLKLVGWEMDQTRHLWYGPNDKGGVKS
jgi:sugar/nucleoside kinase (ribokinase family)